MRLEIMPRFLKNGIETERLEAEQRRIEENKRTEKK